MKQFSWYRWGGVIGSVLLLVVFVVPYFSFAKSAHKLYVNDSANGTQDGSANHPFEKISQAIDKADGFNGQTDIFVSKGDYKENITIPGNVRVVGAGKGDTNIIAKDSGDAVVTMKNKSRIEGVTLKKGRVGIVVKKDAKAEIIDTLIKDNHREGIVALSASRNDDGLVSIVNTEIYDNGWSGIYSEKRKVVILNSDIKNNGRNGVAFARGVKAYFDDSSVSDNHQNGLSMILDDSSLYVASGDTFRNNKLDGIAIVSYGGTGSVVVKKSRMSENDHYGVSRIAKGNVAASVWNGVSVVDSNNYFGNGQGNISRILK
ncbi:MAG: right-handed parallel beta-helix repeat-containing protein [Candidatus Moraniibacteriota bacterium]